MIFCWHRWMSKVAKEKEPPDDGIHMHYTNPQITFITISLGSGETREVFGFDICVKCGKIVPLKEAIL
jgi:hypothetical protein